MGGSLPAEDFGAMTCMRSNKGEEVYGSIPVLLLSQLVLAKASLSCDVCCRFHEQENFLRTYVAREEVDHASKPETYSA